jgi:PAS domain S-box-containing protein
MHLSAKKSKLQHSQVPSQCTKMSIEAPNVLQTLLRSVLTLQQSSSLHQGFTATIPEVAPLVNAEAIWVLRVPATAPFTPSQVASFHQCDSAQWEEKEDPLPEPWLSKLENELGSNSYLTLPSPSELHHIIAAPVQSKGQATGFFIASIPVYQVSENPDPFQPIAPYLEGLGAAISRFTQEKKIKVQRDYLRKIIDNIPGLVFSKDREGRFVLVNKRVAEIYGVPVEELIGKTDSDFNPHKQEVARYRQEDLRVLDEGATMWLPEDKITTPQGQEIHLQTLKIPVTSEGEEGTNNVLGLSLDVSPWLRIKAQEAKSRERYLNFIKHAEEGIYFVKCEPPVPLEGLTPEEQMQYYYASAEIAECNKAMATMYGLESPEDLIGKRVEDLHKGEGEAQNRATTLQFFKEDFKIRDFETHEVTPDGSERWFNNHVVGVF